MQNVRFSILRLLAELKRQIVQSLSGFFSDVVSCLPRRQSSHAHFAKEVRNVVGQLFVKSPHSTQQRHRNLGLIREHTETCVQVSDFCPEKVVRKGGDGVGSAFRVQ